MVSLYNKKTLFFLWFFLSSPQKPKDLEFSHKKLTNRNVGFQMLQKMGWQEGHGLGSRGKGIREPVKVYVMGTQCRDLPPLEKAGILPVTRSL